MSQQGKNEQEILKKLCSDFDVTKEQAKKDLDSFVMQCVQDKVLIKQCNNE